REISGEAYAAMGELMCAGGASALVDIEAFHPSGKAAELVACARRHGVAAVTSNHDFHATPAKEEIVRRLRHMQDVLDADVLKIAVMPQSMRDVLTLLDATEEMRTLYARRPLITMSMGPLGVLSRVAGQAFGSCATFGAAGRCSAPGQMDVYALDACLAALDAGMAGSRS
ncbi:MAG: type I 3-dehydroquinate dehydratase, partial [Mailhella sp.]|nr:type I 3-dehydroquinate dehydratase [Mailhella sp.]